MAGMAFLLAALLLAGSAPGATMRLFDFADPSAAEGWRGIHDVVMGGVSEGRLRAAQGHAVFEGVVRLENNGGFASIRSAPGRFDLGTYDGLALKVRGDGQRYKLHLRTDAGFDGLVYRSAFVAPEARFTTIRLPFSSFEPSFRGRRVPDAPPLDPAAIRTIGFLISEEQRGPFALEIASVDAYD
jgi:hypothetical protein